MACYNPNIPVRGNPFLDIPSDMDSNPFRWVWEDICSVPRLANLIPRIILPLGPFLSGKLDELYPSPPNLRALALQIFLFISQILLLFSLPVGLLALWALPFVAHAAFYAAFAVITSIVVRLLNGPPSRRSLIGVPKTRPPVNDESELWFFINGIATGDHWHQSNLDALAENFGREIVGIHNPTKGLILDLVECLIQRDLDYKTVAIRQGRAHLRGALAAPATKKVVLIAHSQGGIIAASIIDWLFGELSYAQMQKLEVYTFGNAARQFRNPPMFEDPRINSRDLDHGERTGTKETPQPRRQDHGERVLRYIEHYANTKDFVANIGVLQFTTPVAAYSSESLFSGSLFVRQGSGHLFNMHYLDPMFGDGSAFMKSMVEAPEEGGVETIALKPVSELSRLYQYRNGESPEESGGVGAELAKGIGY
ncbi:hypothetical protein BJX68DRAFT_277217 [Aspergillus pseudodeflectus]|uniref:Uncharacterized protein n=1 Tax=Aspergillus pseudodeflectus TaxID=176178 RepID=A0ABR4K230_9EURO